MRDLYASHFRRRVCFDKVCNSFITGPKLKEIEEKVTFAVSFHILATALAFALVNAVVSNLLIFKSPNFF